MIRGQEQIDLEKKVLELVQQRSNHQSNAVRSFGATVFANVSQSVGYLSFQLHWSTLATPIVLGLRGTYRAYSTCMKEVHAVDKKIRECCERLGIPYNH